MKVAVLTVCRERLEYTQHCFAKLREFAGCEFDHYVYDNGSEDGTVDWLARQEFHHLTIGSANVGLSQGFNALLRNLWGTYDVIVKMDNDCELTTPGTLKRTCELALKGYLLSPKILGLNEPPPVIGDAELEGEPIQQVVRIGGIFMAAPAWVYDGWKAPEDSPTYSYEDVKLCAWWARQGGIIGYLTAYPAWHYERVDEQHARYPEYQQRKLVELGLIAG